MPFIARQEPFTCEYCGAKVAELTSGSYRNHCPQCLYSKHVDDQGPGDRASTCHALMKPVGLDHRSGKGWVIKHQCTKCNKEMVNIPADDDDLSILRPTDIPAG